MNTLKCVEIMEWLTSSMWVLCNLTILNHTSSFHDSRMYYPSKLIMRLIWNDLSHNNIETYSAYQYFMTSCCHWYHLFIDHTSSSSANSAWELMLWYQTYGITHIVSYFITTKAIYDIDLTFNPSNKPRSSTQKHFHCKVTLLTRPPAFTRNQNWPLSFS